MPTYEYECTKCHGEFEYLQSISEPKKEICEKCGGQLTKLLSAGTGLIFKGSGFYITDYKNAASGKKSEGQASSSTSTSDSKSSSGATESKKSEDKSGEAAPASTPSSTTSGTKAE